ncbi:MAG: hypothetical protein KGJ62_14095 [Armatimonadetes bacterium]|nr:hypothetical protein [Armatimonadota bacterium]MDE2207009.1 hypothetical protein [Armatimonadota bacterium]
MVLIAEDTAPAVVLRQLIAQHPDVRFLALGQTPLWDEPLKAALIPWLRRVGIATGIVIGVHDTDYFAKSHIHSGGDPGFRSLPHNDGSTRNLWSAAGEVSQLFGSETFLTRHDLQSFGVGLKTASMAAGAAPEVLLDQLTEAWGWRGLVSTRSDDITVMALPLSQVGEPLLRQLQDSVESTVELVGPECCRREGRRAGEALTNLCTSYCQTHPDATLSDLFQHILPSLFRQLLGELPDNITVQSTSRLLRFNRQTAAQKRFQFVELFLNPATRPIAEQAYNHALAGSEIYTLDRFGRGAIPFDVVTRLHGRGTLRVTPRVVFVETRNPVAIALTEPVTSVAQLAEVLEHRFGPDVVLTGKAVALISMLAHEFSFVFSEEGSMYVRRTRAMNDQIVNAGIQLRLMPLLRMRYHTWNSLSEATCTLRLPGHLARAFGADSIVAPEFAAGWRDVVQRQRELSRQAAEWRKPVVAMEHLALLQPAEDWDARRSSWLASRAIIAANYRDSLPARAHIKALWQLLHEIDGTISAYQRGRREAVTAARHADPDSGAEVVALVGDLTAANARRADLCRQIRKAQKGIRCWDRAPAVAAARAEQKRIEAQVDLARIQLLQTAMLTIRGMEHTNHRPTAWWFPVVDSSGRWFQEVIRTLELYTEPVVTAG